MKITKQQLTKIIKEALLEGTGYGPESRGEPGHRDPETGNWIDPGMPGYDPERDKTLAHGAKDTTKRAPKGRDSWVQGIKAYGSAGTGEPYYVGVEEMHDTLQGVLADMGKLVTLKTKEGGDMAGPVSKQIFKELEHAISTFVGKTGG